MNIQIKKLPQSQLEVEIKTTAKQREKARNLALKKLATEVKIDGFRKGYVPENILVQHIGGEKALEHHIIDILLPQTYAEVVKQEKLQVIAQPEVEILNSNPLEYKIKVSVYPEIKLPDYTKIKIKGKEVKVEKKEVEKWTEEFREKVAEFKKVNRKAKKGDRTELDFEGFTLDGVALENTKSKNHPVILGTQTLIPGFEEEVVGMQKDEEKEFVITFPKDYHAKNFAGKKVKFKVKVNLIEERILPEINEALVEKITGTKKSVAEFKKEIEVSLKLQKQKEERMRQENLWIEEVSNKAKLEIPEVLINEEVDFMVDDLKMRGLQQGMPWEKHLEHLKKTEEDLKKEFRGEAEKRVKYRLVTQEVIKKEQISVRDKEVEVAAKRIIESRPPQEQENYKKNYAPSSKGFLQLKNQMILEEMFKKVLK